MRRCAKLYDYQLIDDCEKIVETRDVYVLEFFQYTTEDNIQLTFFLCENEDGFITEESLYFHGKTRLQFVDNKIICQSNNEIYTSDLYTHNNNQSDSICTKSNDDLLLSIL